jgi:hypothetical protein
MKRECLKFGIAGGFMNMWFGITWGRDNARHWEADDLHLAWFYIGSSFFFFLFCLNGDDLRVCVWSSCCFIDRRGYIYIYVPKKGILNIGVFLCVLYRGIVYEMQTYPGLPNMDCESLTVGWACFYLFYWFRFMCSSSVVILAVKDHVLTRNQQSFYLYQHSISYRLLGHNVASYHQQHCGPGFTEEQVSRR